MNPILMCLFNRTCSQMKEVKFVKVGGRCGSRSGKLSFLILPLIILVKIA